MTPQTLAFKDVESKTLGELVQSIPTDQRSLMLRKDEPAGTTMFLLSEYIVDTVPHPTKRPSLHEFQLLRLLQELDHVEQNWADAQLKQAFVKKFPRLTFELWQSCPDTMKRLCMSLDLSAKHLIVDLLTVEEIEALRHLLNLIIRNSTDVDEIRAAKDQLTSVGLPPIMGGSRELVELYLE